MGLSPRMRGSLDLDFLDQPYFGSIPAHAGEPSFEGITVPAYRVYPRACGGADRPLRCGKEQWGLSPRMRGSHQVRIALKFHDGSIPAHAGEPAEIHLPLGGHRVYPRACGGAGQELSALHLAKGLSPRMRGSHYCGVRRLPVRGSIPAHAGEPSTTERAFHPLWVYPRACGGAPTQDPGQGLEWGLSPRMRGSRGALSRSNFEMGSIPAHAGEPVIDSHWAVLRRVYPRACGGAISSYEPNTFNLGLSPRMRGSPALSAFEIASLGSIPAHAGEPSTDGFSWPLCKVYPRACGGACVTSS